LFPHVITVEVLDQAGDGLAGARPGEVGGVEQVEFDLLQVASTLLGTSLSGRSSRRTAPG
jgi:hypothetical protein